MAGLRSFIAWWMGGAGKLASTAVSPTQYICSHTDVSRIVTESDFITGCRLQRCRFDIFCGQPSCRSTHQQRHDFSLNDKGLLMYKIVAGDTIPLKHICTIDGDPFDASTASSVTMQLRRGDIAVGPVITCSSGTSGADWSNSTFVGVLDNSQSASLTAMERVQIQTTVTLSGEPQTFISPLSESISISVRAS